MVDVANLVAPRARAREDALFPWGVASGEYLLATAHRAGNVDDPARITCLVDLLLAVPGPVVLPLHPRTRARLETAGLLGRLEQAPAVRIGAPVGYVEFAALLHHARAVLTDSGGVQKEAYLAGVRCVTLRDTTEWVETVDSGLELAGRPRRRGRARRARAGAPAERPPLTGDGEAGARVVQAISALGLPAR